tara:strand:+ start:31 stop:585 length:555 start_codon:yes stop_codon:yes gene_type:complete
MRNLFTRNREGLIIVTGPSRSGKSKWAENLLINNNLVSYIATSETLKDDENWNTRIKIHQNRRPNHWNLIESPTNLSYTISKIDKSYSILIDSLGGFVTKYIDYSDEEWLDVENDLIHTLFYSKHLIVIVIEEVGWGLVSETKIGNLFKDRIGLLSQKLQRISIQSWLVIQGRAIKLNKISEII